MKLDVRRGWLVPIMVLASGFMASAAFADDSAAVSVSLHASHADVKAGDIVELQLKLTVNNPWHVYGRIPGEGGQRPLSLRLKLPEGVQAVDGWVWPEGSAVLHAGEYVFKQKLRIAAPLESKEVKVMLMYQACNAQLCLPVEMVELDIQLNAAAPTGVVNTDASDPRLAEHIERLSRRPGV